MDAWDLPWCRLTLTLFLFHTGQRSIWLWSGFPHRPGYRKRMCTGCSHITIPGHEMENRNGSTLTRSVSWQPGIIHLLPELEWHDREMNSCYAHQICFWVYRAKGHQGTKDVLCNMLLCKTSWENPLTIYRSDLMEGSWRQPTLAVAGRREDCWGRGARGPHVSKAGLQATNVRWPKV